MQEYAKGAPASIFEQLLDRLPTAMLRSAQALNAAKVEQEPNPSTEFHILISELERLGMPVAVA